MGNQEEHERARARPASSDASDNESSAANCSASNESSKSSRCRTSSSESACSGDKASKARSDDDASGSDSDRRSGSSQSSDSRESNHSSQSSEKAPSMRARSSDESASETEDSDKGSVSSDPSEEASCSARGVERVAVAAPQRETLSEHAKRHDYPTHVKTCQACGLYRDHDKFAAQAVAVHPRTKESIYWLLVDGAGNVGCSICQGAGMDNLFARCLALPKLNNIRRHGNLLAKQASGAMKQNEDHAKALARLACDTANADAATDAAAQTEPPHLSFTHLVFGRTQLETGDSHLAYTKWAKAARLAGVTGLQGRHSVHAARMTQTMALRERLVNARLLRAASRASLIDDGRGSFEAVLMKAPIWEWPKGLELDSVTGLRNLAGHGSNRGPWVACRVLDVPALDKDHSAEGKARAIVSGVKRNIFKEGDWSHYQRIFKARATDSASAEQLAGHYLRRPENLPKKVFDMLDPSHAHSRMAGYIFAGDEEIELVTKLLITGYVSSFRVTSAQDPKQRERSQPASQPASESILAV